MKEVLIDTDVILDFLLDRKPFSDDAANLLALCEKGEIKGYVTAIMLSNIYYLLRRTSKHEKVIAHLQILMSILDVLSTDKDIALAALNSDFKDFEDALQNFSAQKSQTVKVIITRNIKDYKSSELSVMTPQIYLKGRK